MWGNVNNIEIMCAGCNGFRSSCGNCWGLVACIESVARDTGQPREKIYRTWKTGLQKHLVDIEDAAIKPTVRSVQPPHVEVRGSAGVILRMARNHEQVRLGIFVDRVGVSEFIFPADTPAKRVWNLATLAKGGYDGPVPADLQ